MVVAVGDEAQGERQRRHHHGPAVEVEQRSPLGEADVRHPVVEVGAVGFVEGPAVFQPLGDHEAGVEDRHGEHDQRQEESDHRIGLQRALHRHRPEQVAEQVGAGVAHEGAGGREAVTQEAEGRPRGERREHAGGGAVEREGDHRQGQGRDHADARRKAVDPVDQVDHVDHRDDAEHRRHLAEVDRPPQGSVSRSTVPGVSRPKKGKVKFWTVTPAATGTITAAV